MECAAKGTVIEFDTCILDVFGELAVGNAVVVVLVENIINMLEIEGGGVFVEDVLEIRHCGIRFILYMEREE